MSTLLVVLSTLLAVVFLEALAFLVIWHSPKLMKWLDSRVSWRRYEFVQTQIERDIANARRIVIEVDEPTQL